MPDGYKIGRCLLIVKGQTRISGKCAYSITKGGELSIEGPRQIYDGIDYPKAEGMAAMLSTDYWAEVFKDEGGWTGYGNNIVSSVHGADFEQWKLRRLGACFVGPQVRVCVWRK